MRGTREITEHGVFVYKCKIIKLRSVFKEIPSLILRVNTHFINITIRGMSRLNFIFHSVSRTAYRRRVPMLVGTFF